MPYRNPKDPENLEKARISRKEWYYRNQEKAKLRTKNHRKEKIEWYENYKSTLKCHFCAENHPACIAFHHLDQNKKEIEISQAIHREGWSIERLKKEIEKCQPLCSNCHLKLHWNIRKNITPLV